jgi:hypothetical protein
MNNIYKLLILKNTYLFCLLFNIHAQEYLTSPIYQYYRFLELDGSLKINTLNYYSLSDTNNISFKSIIEHPWKNYINFRNINKNNGDFKILPFEGYYSYNIAYPRGFNDGSPWQGKGSNMTILGGVLFNKWGFSAYIAPLIWYAQNMPFPTIPSDPSHDSNYSSFIPNIDEPQRFGDKPIYNLDWGESEIRYTYHHFTIGIGTQSVWIGPALKNSLILSNNAGGFPKIDIGLYPWHTITGIFEFRAFLGYLQNSPIVDLDLKEKDRYILGYSLSYSPAFIPDLILGFHITAITYEDSLIDMFQAFSFMNSNMGKDAVDQRASLTFQWLFPTIGFSTYGEWARNDFNDTLRRFLTQLHHSQAYTIGIRQLVYSSNNYKIGLIFELTQAQHTIDYQTDINVGRGTAGFYTHHIIQQGYTYKGQILGAAIGSGGSSQFLGLDIYSSKNKITLFFFRRLINIDYIYGKPEPRNLWAGRENVEISFGSSIFHFISKYFAIQSEVGLIWALNRNYIPQNDLVSGYFNLLIRYNINN